MFIKEADTAIIPMPDRLADFIFLWWEEANEGVFVSREYYRFLLQFQNARATCTRWSEFLESIGPWGVEFIAPALEYDSINPTPSSSMTDLEGELWILSDTEFPLTQCAEETFTEHISRLLPDEPCELLSTEYGMQIGCYPKASFVHLKKRIEQHGFTVDSKCAEFPMTLCDYSRPASKADER